MGRRARALAMLGGAAVCAGLAASAVTSYTNDIRAQVGPLVPVVVARTEIAQGKLLTSGGARTYLSTRRVPARFVPPSALRLAREAIGYRALTTIRAGDYLSGPSPGGQARPRRAGATSLGRVVEVPGAGAETIAQTFHRGSRGDGLITTHPGGA